MAEMSEHELLALTADAVQDSVQFNGSFMKDNERLQARYLGNPYGDEVEGRSQVISTDVSDVVDLRMSEFSHVGKSDEKIFSEICFVTFHYQKDWKLK